MEVTVKGEKHKIDLVDVITIQGKDLDQVIADAPEQKAFFGRLAVDAGFRYRKSRIELQELEAIRFRAWKMWLEERMEDQGQSTKYLSAKEVFLRVDMDDEVLQKREEVELLRRDWETLNLINEVLDHKKSSLMALGARQRDELNYQGHLTR